MGILATIHQRRRVYPGQSIDQPRPWLAALLGGGQDDDGAGVRVDHDSAMSLATFWACVNRISADVAKLPLHVYQRNRDGSKARVADHPVEAMMNRSWSGMVSAFVGRETCQAFALTWGNGYAEIERNGRGDPVAIHPIEAWRVTPRLASDKSGVVYDVAGAVGSAALASDDIIHVHGLGSDGIKGYSVIHRARRTLGLALATEVFGSSFFGRGAMPKVVLEHPGKLKDSAALKKSWTETHGGPYRAQGVAVLEEGMKAHTLTVPPDDAQFLETRSFQGVQVCQWFSMPPPKVGILDRATWSNIEHLAIAYVQETLMAWLVRWEQEIARKMLPAGAGFYVEHLVDALLRGDTTSRAQAYATARQWGWMSANDIRAAENQPGLGKQGDIYLIPANMIPADMAGQAAAAGVADKADQGGDKPKPGARSRSHAGPVAVAMRQVIEAEVAAFWSWTSERAQRCAPIDQTKHQAHVRQRITPIVSSYLDTIGYVDGVQIDAAARDTIATQVADLIVARCAAVPPAGERDRQVAISQVATDVGIILTDAARGAGKAVTDGD